MPENATAPVHPEPALVDEPRRRIKAPLTIEQRRKRDRRRRLLASAVLVTVLLLGGGLIVGTSFYDQVITPSEMMLENATEVWSWDGKTQIAQLGSTNRTEVPMAKLPESVRNALIAGEDKNFYSHKGIDVWGVGRAAWNNLTGGATQGASTITQQYARHAANDMKMTYARKFREAVMARKLENEYSKIDILGFYLNTVYFGRGAYGIGAAADMYFGILPDNIETMTVAQAAVLGAVLKQPEPYDAAKGYDPQNDPVAAKDRWTYVLNNMVEMRWLNLQERSAMTYPQTLPFDADKQAAWGYTNSGTGYVIRYIEQELFERGVILSLKENLLGNWRNAGLRITTTIDPRVQSALEAQLNRAVAGSSLSQQRENIIGAGVAIDPTNGRVLAYYGGTNSGTNTDWAGTDAPHPPGSTFKIYTLAAGLAEGISVASYGDPREPTNGNEDPPFYNLTARIGPQKVMQMAANAGIRTAWQIDPEKPIDLTKTIPSGRDPFDYNAGIGQYPITVLDHASGTATFANRGKHFAAHFVIKVERKNRKTREWEPMPFGDEKPFGTQRVSQAVADDVTGVLKQKAGNDPGAGRESAGITGTWENGAQKPDSSQRFPGTNAHAWYTGFTNQISATIWIGSKDYNATPIRNPNGTNMGSAYPQSLWKTFMDQVYTDLNLGPTKLPSSRATGGQGRSTPTWPSPGQSPGCDPSCFTPDPDPTPTPTEETTTAPSPPTPSVTPT